MVTTVKRYLYDKQTGAGVVQGLMLNFPPIVVVRDERRKLGWLRTRQDERGIYVEQVNTMDLWRGSGTFDIIGVQPPEDPTQMIVRGIQINYARPITR